MAYDFPASPSENQEFTPAGGVTYIYKAPHWVVKQQAVACVVADTAPLDMPDGQLWWNSADGNLYIYYYDGTSRQWVQVNSTGV
jgi:hypothetical protein